MQRAIDMAMQSIQSGGGPFGAVIVRDGAIISSGNNKVVLSHDPTAHAEVVAIRSACAALQSHILSDCVLYTSCEPCPMCLAAIYWARIPTVFFGADRFAAAHANFDDSLIYSEIAQPIDQRKIAMAAFMSSQANAIFQAWLNKTDRTPY